MGLKLNRSLSFLKSKGNNSQQKRRACMLYIKHNFWLHFHWSIWLWCCFLHKHPSAPFPSENRIKDAWEWWIFKKIKGFLASPTRCPFRFNHKYWELLLLAAAVGAFKDVTHSGLLLGSCQHSVLRAKCSWCTGSHAFETPRLHNTRLWSAYPLCFLLHFYLRAEHTTNKGYVWNESYCLLLGVIWLQAYIVAMDIVAGKHFIYNIRVVIANQN